VYAALADVTYSSGFAATGGAIALRVVGGTAIDAVGWGDASSSFVEGTAVCRAACRLEHRASRRVASRQRDGHE
jgi:hypothetical protein